MLKNLIMQCKEGKTMDKYKKNKQEKDDSQSHNKNKLSSICISNMSILVCKVVEKSLMKNVILPSMDEKKIGQIQERISRRRLVPNITIQQVIINLHTKYENSSLYGSWEIFDEIFHSSKY